MSYCKEEGKDKIIFVTEEDHNTPSTIKFEEPNEESAGLINSTGEINWSCPCLGGMATGPCGVEFRDAFTCFHYSDNEPKGSECLDNFREMSMCMAQYPGVYGSGEENVMNIEEDNGEDDNNNDSSKITSSDVAKSSNDDSEESKS